MFFGVILASRGDVDASLGDWASGGRTIIALGGVKIYHFSPNVLVACI